MSKSWAISCFGHTPVWRQGVWGTPALALQCVGSHPLHPGAGKTGLAGYWTAMLWKSMGHDFPIFPFPYAFRFTMWRRGLRALRCAWERVGFCFFSARRSGVCRLAPTLRRDKRQEGSLRCFSSRPIPLSPSTHPLLVAGKKKKQPTPNQQKTPKVKPFQQIKLFHRAVLETLLPVTVNICQQSCY